MREKPDAPICVAQDDQDIAFAVTVDVLVIGAGAAGLVSALRAIGTGASVLVLERDALPRGSTALSAGLVPAAGTRFQRAAGIVDTPKAFAQDILRKADHEPDTIAVEMLVRTIGPALEWLADAHCLPFDVVEGFTYPGHSALRMHGLPQRSGAELMDRLTTAAGQSGIDIITDAHVRQLWCDGHGRIHGAVFMRPDGSLERVGCRALVLACNGYGGNRDLVARHIGEMDGALYFGHVGNQGDALIWGEALGAATRHLSGYQGHGSVAYPHGILISWAAMTEGGFLVNAAGERFTDESSGYSEAAAAVIHQSGGIAYAIFDERIAAIARQFEDFRAAEAQQAVLRAPNFASLADALRLPAQIFASTCLTVDREKQGSMTPTRDWQGKPLLAAPFCAVRVTGALFHTQGGLVVDEAARVIRKDGTIFPNLFAAGGAACGVSGKKASGYLSGNGLLTAVGYGFVSGKAAADSARDSA